MSTQVVILSGIPGSGKSTHARKLIEQNGGEGIILSADSYFTNPETGVYKFKSYELQRAHAEVMRKFIDACASGVKLIVVDNTNTSIEQISPWYMVAKAFKINDVRIVMLKCPVKLGIKRNIHGVPTHNIQQHGERFRHLRIPNTWKTSIEVKEVYEDEPEVISTSGEEVSE